MVPAKLKMWFTILSEYSFFRSHLFEGKMKSANCLRFLYCGPDSLCNFIGNIFSYTFLENLAIDILLIIIYFFIEQCDCLWQILFNSHAV